MTPVSLLKTTESYKVLLVTINLQTSYDSDIVCQDYGIIRDLPMDNQTERAVHSCNSCLRYHLFEGTGRHQSIPHTSAKKSHTDI